MISIIIVNWNTGTYLRECLALLRTTTGDIEVIVIDNSSRDDSVSIVNREFPEVILLPQSENLGYAAGNNLGLAAARGDKLLLLNPDVRIFPGALEAAENCLNAVSFRGAVGAKQIGTDGKIQQSLRGFPDPDDLLWEVLGLSRAFPGSRRFGRYRLTWFDYNSQIDVDQPMATFLMVKRSVYEKVGPLDPQFPIFFNDVDWCRRIKDAGYTITYCPELVIAHYGGAGTSRAPKPAMIRQSHRSLALYYKKHYSRSLTPAMLSVIRSIIIFSGELRERIGIR